ncbi:Spherical Body Protein 2 truncated copy 5 (SBP2) [Babesia bovis T2Bo]|uniref:Spherical Body Protein 2 truncated copy 5 (SBP2) n=1 Tax=Babesia bovis TaxID=5865 RepID=A7ANL2_BABBO|nr:Spherical Body Protein 2 truncated copy 5 (SBP2) [Babesia bovis T2Bo]EDO08146.1 Spherical Body Protein 2 truncated copy 5 (SBP2) [Babesia bovis T2Bo]|eukprot:XP_001611714.1 Spherical Body Protein 2 truncated copy 5 (SBP2) [Babesia bovis T2Bo]
MEVARRNNGFRKVAKWIAGAIVVAGAASGNVLCDEVSEPQEAEVAEVKSEINVNEEINTEVKDSKRADVNVAEADITFEDPGKAYRRKVAAVTEEEKLLQAPDAVIFRNVVGRQYTNKEIDDLVDRSGLKGTKGVIQHELGVRKIKLLREMGKFNTILESLPKEIAEEAGNYATYDRLPADLAEKVKWNHFNKSFFGLMEKVPQDLANEMMGCDIYEGFPGELIFKIKEFLHPFDPSTVFIDDGKDEDMADNLETNVRIEIPSLKPLSNKPATAEQIYRVIRDYPPTTIGDSMDVEVSSPFNRFSRDEKRDDFSKSKAIKNFRKIINHITGYCLKLKDQAPYGDIYMAFEDASTIKLPVDIAAELASLPDDFRGLFPGAAVAPKTILYLGQLLTEGTHGRRPLSGRSRAVWDKHYETNTEALYDAISVI